MAEGEKLFTIPLRKAYRKSREKRADYSIRLIADYLRSHTNKGEVKLGRHLNEEVWSRGKKKPPRRVRVKAVVDGESVKAELMGHEFAEFRAAPKTEKKGGRERMLERLGAKALKKEEEEAKIEGSKEEPKIETPKNIVEKPEAEEKGPEKTEKGRAEPEEEKKA